MNSPIEIHLWINLYILSESQNDKYAIGATKLCHVFFFNHPPKNVTSSINGGEKTVIF